MTLDIKTGIAGEGSHWYTRTGEAVYQVPSADGKRMIEPDLRHARKLGLVPGVIAPLRGPGAYRHVLGSSSRPSRVADNRLDRVIDPAAHIRHEYVLPPTGGAGGAAGMGTIAI